MQGVVYIIKCKIDGRIYVGRTMNPNLDAYWGFHISNAKYVRNGRFLYKEMDRLGVEHFEFQVIERVQGENKIDLNNKLNEKEAYYIQKLDTLYPNGFNRSKGFDMEKGKSVEDFTKEKLSETRIRLQIPSPNKGKNLSAEHRKNLSIVRMGKFKGEDNHFYNKKHTEETKELIRKKNTEYQNRPDIKLENKLKQPNRKEVNMKSQEDLILRTFISLREAGRWIASNTKYKGDTKSIKMACESGRLSFGYYWEYNDKHTHN